MNIKLKEIIDETKESTVNMITDFMNYHRKLTNAPKEYWQTNLQSEILLKEWISDGIIYNIFSNNVIVGFIYVKFGGQNVAWLEDFFILEEYRCNGIGKLALNKLDEIMIDKNVISMFVDVIPRNASILRLYQECGFDHLNLVQLRKNYNNDLDKDDVVEVLGFEFKMY
ncbi:GNAT family N-acetyltransferase [Clostridium perfringens]|nr:GNAT family N-acetyltransferase [Clostridium perfringens]